MRSFVGGGERMATKEANAALAVEVLRLCQTARSAGRAGGPCPYNISRAVMQRMPERAEDMKALAAVIDGLITDAWKQGCGK